MALSVNSKLGIAVGVLAIAGIGVAYQLTSQGKENAAHTLDGRAAALPPLTSTGMEVQQADQVSITIPGKDGNKPVAIILKKDGESWKIAEPVTYAADTSRVDGLLDTLASMKLTERVSTAEDTYSTFGVTDDAGKHVVATSAGKPILDVVVGEGGTRGQMVRVTGTPGVYAVSGYAKHAVERSVDEWRSRSIMQFDADQVTTVHIKNKHGVLEFRKDGGGWAAQFNGGTLAKFDADKLNQLLNAYKNLNAYSFGDGQTPATAGTENPTGVMTVTLSDGSTKELIIGAVANEGPNHWAKLPSGDQIFEISSRVAEWATGDAKQYVQAPPKPVSGKPDSANAAPESE